MKSPILIAGLAAMTISAAANAGVREYLWQGDMAVPDNNPAGISIDIDVSDMGTISDINVGLMVTTTWQGDMIATIEHVNSGTVVPLIYRPGDSGGGGAGFSADNFGNAATGDMFWLDDEAVEAYDSNIGWGNTADPGITDVTGSWVPYGAFAGGGMGGLNMFDGLDKKSVWRLNFSDNAGGDAMSVQGIALSITNVPAPGALALLGVAGLVGRRRRR